MYSQRWQSAGTGVWQGLERRSRDWGFSLSCQATLLLWLTILITIHSVPFGIKKPGSPPSYSVRSRQKMDWLAWRMRSITHLLFAFMRWREDLHSFVLSGDCTVTDQIIKLLSRRALGLRNVGSTSQLTLHWLYRRTALHTRDIKEVQAVVF